MSDEPEKKEETAAPSELEALKAVIAANQEQIAELQRALAEQSESVKATHAKAAEAARAAFVEKINGGLVDDSVWALVPQADASTEEGRKALRDWAAKHPTLFRGVNQPAAPKPASSGRAFRTLSQILGGGQ